MVLTDSFQMVSSGACYIQPSGDFVFGFKTATPTDIFIFDKTKDNKDMNYNGNYGALYAKKPNTHTNVTLSVVVV